MTDYWLQVVDASNGANPILADLAATGFVNGSCVQDTSGHPGGVFFDTMTMAESIADRGLNPVNAAHESTLAASMYWIDAMRDQPGNTTLQIGPHVTSMNGWVGGKWILGHWIMQDPRSGGGITIPAGVNLSTATTSQGANDAAVAMLDIGTNIFPLPWSVSTDLPNIVEPGTNTTLTTTVRAANNNPVPNVRIHFDTSEAVNISHGGGNDAYLGVTDGNGQIQVQVQAAGNADMFSAGVIAPDLPNGTMTVLVGSGQDVVTWTSMNETDAFASDDAEAPPEGFATVVKTVDGLTADAAYVSPQGVVLVMRDGNDVSLGEQTVGADGTADWGPIDVGQHPPPYRVYELSAPPGVTPPDPDVAVATLNIAMSSNPAAPSVLDVDNTLAQPKIRIRKQLSDPADLPPGENMGGFEFSVTRDDDTDFGTHSTDALTGQTLEIDVTFGTYTICEVGRPAWSLALNDPPNSCIEVVVDQGDDNSPPIVFDFVNVSHSPEAASVMATPYIEPGGQAVDRVWMRDTVPGRTYRADVAWHHNPPQTAATDAVCTNENALFAGQVELVGSDGERLGEIVVDVPADAPTGNYFAAGQIVDIATGYVVANLPCGDLLERASLVSIETVSPHVVDVASEWHDTYTADGLPVENPPTSVIGTFPLHDISTECLPESELVDTIIEPVTGNGTFVTTDGVVTEAGVYVFRETLTITTTITARPPGWSTNPDGVDGDQVDVEFTTTPELCNPAETTWVGDLRSQVRDKILTGQASQDDVIVDWLPDPLPDDATVVIEGGLYFHDPESPITERVCTADNLVATIDPITVTGNGTYLTEPIFGYPAGVHLSYQEQLRITRSKPVDGELVVEEFVTAPHGCQEPAQTQYVPHVVTQVQDSIVYGDASIDNVTVTGLGHVDRFDEGLEVSVELGLFHHPVGSSIGNRVCTSSNLVAMANAIAVTGDGTYSSSPILGYPFGVDLSYQEQLYVTYTWPDGTVEEHVLGPSGCNEPSETQYAQQPTRRNGTIPTPTRRNGTLAYGGGGSHSVSLIGVAGALGVVGIALVSAAALSRRRHQAETS